MVLGRRLVPRERCHITPRRRVVLRKKVLSRMPNESHVPLEERRRVRWRQRRSNTARRIITSTASWSDRNSTIKSMSVMELAHCIDLCAQQSDVSEDSQRIARSGERIPSTNGYLQLVTHGTNESCDSKTRIR